MAAPAKSIFLNGATVLTAVAASMCCILPVAVALLGVGSAALGGWMEPARPYLMVLTIVFLGFAFYGAYRPQPCAEGECAAPPSRRGQRIFLWIVAVLSAVLLAFPHYIPWLL